MKRLSVSLFAMLSILATTCGAGAKDIQVKGYTKKDGTVVKGYTRHVKDKDTTVDKSTDAKASAKPESKASTKSATKSDTKASAQNDAAADTKPTKKSKKASKKSG